MFVLQNNLNYFPYFFLHIQKEYVIKIKENNSDKQSSKINKIISA